MKLIDGAVITQPVHFVAFFGNSFSFSWSSVRLQTMMWMLNMVFSFLLQASHSAEGHQADPSDGAEDREGD